MNYTVLLHPKAAEFLKKIDRINGDRIKTELKLLRNATDHCEKLVSTPFWKIRIGDYRAILEINHAEKKIIVLFIGHRKNVYDDSSKLL